MAAILAAQPAPAPLDWATERRDESARDRWPTYSLAVTEFQVTYWRELPSLVVARSGDDVTKSLLAARFQGAIDEAAMRLGEIGSDDYLAGWRRSEWTAADGEPAEVAERISRRTGGGLDGPGHLRLPRCPGQRMSRLSDLLGDAPVVLDGAMGTLLQDSGLDDGGAGELWNVERPELITDAHQEYAAAGARILTTNTFGGTRPRLQMHGLEDRVHELNEAAARLARGVADEHGVLVAGDLGPTGELLEPLGTMSSGEAQGFFAEQLSGLAAGGIDVVLIETMSDLGEVEAAVAAARAVTPDLPIIATLSFDTNLRTMMGVRPGDAVRALGRWASTRSAPTVAVALLRWRPSRRSWWRLAPTACCWWRSPTPGCPRSSETISSTTHRRPRWPRMPSYCVISASK